jgi:hypothetical protein
MVMDELSKNLSLTEGSEVLILHSYMVMDNGGNIHVSTLDMSLTSFCSDKEIKANSSRHGEMVVSGINQSIGKVWE